MAPELHEVRMRDDAVSDVDRETIGRVARASLRHEDKVPGPVIRRAGLCNRYGRDQAARGYRGREEVFHCVLHCFRQSIRKGRPVLGRGKDRPQGSPATDTGRDVPGTQTVFQQIVTAAPSMRLAKHERERDDEQLVALVVADMQDPVAPIHKAVLVGEELHEAGRMIARLSEIAHHGAVVIEEYLLGVGAVKIYLGHI